MHSHETPPITHLDLCMYFAHGILRSAIEFCQSHHEAKPSYHAGGSRLCSQLLQPDMSHGHSSSLTRTLRSIEFWPWLTWGTFLSL